jgi:hypothetical protein
MISLKSKKITIKENSLKTIKFYKKIKMISQKTKKITIKENSLKMIIQNRKTKTTKIT